MYIVKKLIKAGADVNRSRYCVSPLLVACINGHFNVAKELITAGADVDVKNISLTQVRWVHGFSKVIRRENLMMEELTPLIAACDCGSSNILKLLMKSGAKVDPNDNDKTTLNFPSYWDQLNIKSLLLISKV